MQTFVVRVFVPAGPERLPLCGLIEFGFASNPEVFENAEELIRLLEAYLQRPEPAPKVSKKGAP